jgi:hypothetical protein
MGRPPNPNTTNFLRKIGKAEQTILAVAGKGDISQGFLEILDVYRHFYNQGLRPNMNHRETMQEKHKALKSQGRHGSQRKG